MALKVWLPLNGNLENKGISSLSLSATPTFVTGGKIGEKCLNSQVGWFAVPEMAGKKQMSFAYWVKINAETTTNWLDTFSWYTTNGSSAHRGRQEFYYFSNGAGKTGCWYYNSSNSGFDITVGSWDHYAFTIDFSTGISNFYKNGVLLKTTTNIDTTYYVRGTGNSFLLRESTLDCSINDFRLYDHILSAKEIKEISQGLVLHYKLDGFSGGAGRNLLRKPTTETGYGARNELTELTFSGWDKYADLDLVDIDWNNQVGKKLTYRCWLNNIEQTAGTGTGIMLHVRYADSTYQQYGGGKNGTTGSYLAQGESGWIFITITIPDPTVRTNPTTITKIQASIRHNSSGGASTIEYKNSQVELSDIPTTFGFAPEDFGIDTTKITDSSGYGNNGIVTGNLTINSDSKRYMNSTVFDGSSNISLTNFYIGNEWSYGCWIYSPTSSRGWEGIIILNSSGGDSDTQLGFFTNPGGNRIQNTANGQYNSGIAMTYGQWNHFFGTFDGSNLKTYINGVLVNTKAITNTLLSKFNLTIGARSSNANGAAVSAAYPFLGELSDIRIYATALSAEDILNLYHTPANIDNLGGVHGFEMVEDTPSKELLALPWTSSYSTHNKTSISTNYNDKHEWYSNVSSSSAGSDYIKINPTGKTYYYDTEISVAAGNQFYIGFERYDANKTSRSNNACVYIVSIKPTSDIVHQRYSGTVNLATDGVNPTDTIALRILNAWSGTDSGSTKEGTIHYLSLREVTGKPQTGKIKQQGQIYTDEFVEREKQASIYENGFVGGNIIIEK